MSKIHGINGPVLTVVSEPGESLAVSEMIEVAGKPGEVLALLPHGATVQVYEDTAGLKPGIPVTGTGKPMSVTMRPGIIGQIFDGADVIIGLYQ